MELLGRLKKAVKKLTFLLKLKKYLSLRTTWQLTSLFRDRAPALIAGGRPRWHSRRALSFGDRPGLRACVDDFGESDNDHHVYDGDESDRSRSSGATSPYELRRTTSYPLEEDVDKRADMFIANFHWHLIYERQVSLDLRYCRRNSDNSSANNYAFSPLSSSASSLLVSPT